MKEQAIKKLDTELEAAAGKGGAAGAVAKDTARVLKSFCEKYEEFAEAVVKSEKSLAECCEYTVKDCGSSISDAEVFARAARFYMPDAEVKAEITLILPQVAKAPGKVLSLNLEDFI